MQALEDLRVELMKHDISVFTVTKDEKGENPAVEAWITKHDGNPHSLFPAIVTGAGSLILCVDGDPIHIETTTWHMSSEEIKSMIVSQFKKHRHNQSSHLNCSSRCAPSAVSGL